MPIRKFVKWILKILIVASIFFGLLILVGEGDFVTRMVLGFGLLLIGKLSWDICKDFYIEYYDEEEDF